MLHTSPTRKSTGRMEKSLIFNSHVGGEEREIRRRVVRLTRFWMLVREEKYKYGK